jgi:hypothetical protein
MNVRYCKNLGVYFFKKITFMNESAYCCAQCYNFSPENTVCVWCDADLSEAAQSVFLENRARVMTVCYMLQARLHKDLIDTFITPFMWNIKYAVHPV